MDSEIIIEFQMGTLRIRGGPAPREIPERTIEVNGYPVSLINVPEVERPGLNAIEYCPYYDNLSEIMLLEETQYHVLFEGSGECDVLPSLKRDAVFQELRFQLEEKSAGFLNFRSYAGKSFLDVSSGDLHETIPVEVRSKKINYHEQYPAMLSDLSDEITSLILNSDSPIFQRFTVDEHSARTLYEDFLILEHIFRPENLHAAAEHINQMYSSGLRREVELVPAGLAATVDPEEIISVISTPGSIDGGIPRVLPEVRLRETPDIPENRFYRYFLESLEDLILRLLETAPEGYISDSLEGFLDDTRGFLSARWLMDVGELSVLPLNSQVLQKREGYRDILRYFFMLDLSLRFTWDELEDAIRGFERKLSELYEYWCYFRIMGILEDITGDSVNPCDIFDLNDWNVRLRRGMSVLRFSMGDVELALSYNGRFTRNTRCSSYSLPFRPDYSLLVDVGECTYFIHLDAKYRSTVNPEDFYDIDLRDAEEELESRYRDGDVYKMHTYKDAILHSMGAYILYPGSRRVIFNEETGEVPSVGAFPMRPGDSAADEKRLRDFIERAIRRIAEEK